MSEFDDMDDDEAEDALSAATNTISRLRLELEAAGSPADEASANGSAYARLKWWGDRADDMHEEIVSLRGRLSRSNDARQTLSEYAELLNRRLAAERALADGLARELQCEGEYENESDALAAYNQARNPAQTTGEGAE